MLMLIVRMHFRKIAAIDYENTFITKISQIYSKCMHVHVHARTVYYAFKVVVGIYLYHTCP